MTQVTPKHQTPQPRWMPEVPRSTEQQLLQQRIEELEGQIKAYEQLLDELPELFERKFQQRLEPLMERYQLLAQQLDHNQRATSTIQLCLLPRDRALSMVQTM